MAGRVRHLINRYGRYHARLVVPKELRSAVGKTELRKPLGGDYRAALRLLPGAVAELQHQIGLAERKAGQGSPSKAARYPLAPDQIARSHYDQRLAFDDQLRNDPRYSAVGVDDVLVAQLREAVAGRLDDDRLNDLVGAQIGRFRAAGNLDATPGSDEWRTIARALCGAELEALERVAERDEGDFSGQPTNPLIANARAPEEPRHRVSLSELWTSYKASRVQASFMRDGGRRQDPVVEALRKFVGHDDAMRLTKKDLMGWRDHLMKSLSARTVSDVYLSTVRSLLKWAVDGDLLPENVAANVRQPKPRKQYSRERGYTEAEANTVLRASRSYQPRADDKGRIREKPHLVAAKRWVPLICAFTGARVTEITQLRKNDVRQEGDYWVIRITPEAGSLKAGDYRDVPLHPQIVDEGFVEFVRAAGAGPLFHGGTAKEDYRRKAGQISNQLATWLSKAGLTPKGVWPNHAWRHRLKTQCRELGMGDRVPDAICGHVGRTAGENYGDVTLTAKWNVIKSLPSYTLA